MKISTEVSVINDISTLLFYKEGTSNLPLIMIVHGFGNDKYEGAKLALKLSEVGFAVLCFDIDRHGARYNGFMDHLDNDVALGKELFTVVENTYLDIEKLLRALSDNDRLDINRLGIVGLSIGANIANYGLGRLKNLKACVSLLGSPNFEELLVYCMEKDSVKDFITDEEKNLLTYVQSLDPKDCILNTETPCPWLMINGSKDDNVPAAFAVNFYETYKDMYRSDIESIVEDEFHYVSDSMIGKTVEWLMKYLL